ncbi:NAD(P)/FAD-dependent oxidoreductase [Lysobacter sp. TAB13]|uniref:NAD(P)/FAD-dependent oxidoreductase n=1 Tax=Lysobacter sp. TAB13 TaxID=3233065 RepID=UPI003F9AFE96
MNQDTAHYDCDLVVVGASFAGAACALAAARAGLRVVVLERKRDPGDKLRTTGIVVKEAAEQTWLSRAPAGCLHRVERVRLYSPKLRSMALSAPGYYFLTTDTPRLMRWLAQELVRHEVDLRLGASFTQAERDGEGWRIEGVGRTRFLVGADGAKSRVAERTGLGRTHEFLYGIEYEFPQATLPESGALHCFVSKRYAPGYIGWVAQNPTGVQAGLALRHDPERARVPDIDGFLARVRDVVGLGAQLQSTATRAGLIPCGGPVFPLARDGVMLTGDAAGIVSPVTAGGIHSAWAHGETLGQAIALHARGIGPAPESIAQDAAPKFRRKRALRWAFDRFQFDWPFDLLLHSAPLRWAAEQVYFHKRGVSEADIEAGAVRSRAGEDY